MTITIAQHNGSDTPGGTTTVPTLSYTGAQTAANLNIVGINWQAAVTSVKVTDQTGNQYFRGLSFTTGLTVPSSISEIWYCLSIGAAAAGNTVSVTFSGASTGPELWLAEANTTTGSWSFFVPGDTGTASSGTAMATKGLVIPSGNVLGYGFGVSGNGSGLNGNSGWTNLDNLAGGDTDFWQAFTAGGLVTATATQGTSAAWDIVAAYFLTSPYSVLRQGRDPRKRYVQIQAFPPVAAATAPVPVIVTPAAQLPVPDVAKPAVLIGGALPSAGRILIPIETPVLTTPLPVQMRGGALPASAAILIAGATLPPPTDPAVATRGAAPTGPLSGSLGAAETPRPPTDAATLLRAGALPASGARPVFPGAPSLPTDPASVFIGSALPKSGANPQPPSTLSPPTDPGVVLRGAALPSSGANPLPPSTQAPPTDPARLVLGTALPPSGAFPSFPGAPSLPTDPASLLKGATLAVAASKPTPAASVSPPTDPAILLRGGTLPASGRALAAAPTEPPPAFPTASRLIGGTLPSSARVLSPPATDPPPAFPTAALLRGFSPPAISPGRILFPQHSDPPPTLPASLLSGATLPPSGQATRTAATDMPPLFLPVIVFGSALPAFATLRVEAESRPPPTEPGTVRASAPLAPGVARAVAATEPPPTPLGLVLTALAPPVRTFLPLTPAASVPPQDPGARFLVGVRAPPASGLLLMAPTEVAERGFSPSVLYRSQVLLGGAFARPRVNVWPLADMRIQPVRSLPTVGDMRAMVCRIVQPGTFTPMEADGSSLTAVAFTPTGSTVALVVTRVSIGVYWAALTLTASGDWFVRFTGALNGMALFAETQVYCRSPEF